MLFFEIPTLIGVSFLLLKELIKMINKSQCKSNCSASLRQSLP